MIADIAYARTLDRALEIAENKIHESVIRGNMVAVIRYRVSVGTCAKLHTDFEEGCVSYVIQKLKDRGYIIDMFDKSGYFLINWRLP